MEVSPNSTTQPLNMYDYINNYFMSPPVFTALILVVLTIVVISIYLGKSSNNGSVATTTPETNGSMKIYGTIAFVLFIVLIIVNGTQYYFGTNFYSSITGLFYGNPEVDIKVIPEDSQVSVPLPKSTINNILGMPSIEEINNIDQVFNIPGNKYTYEDAKAVCSAYGSRLANYDEVESAYNSGGEWCNYGWSNGQMALFPTQKTTYNNLQKIKGHEHDCGRPGVNGGYIANPNVKFGINCYGHKPKINQEEQHLMDVTTPYPKTKEELELEKKVSYWKNKINDILVSPFNYTSWSKI